MDEELETLREKSTRASSVYDELDEEAPAEGGGFAASLRSLSASQRLILALLLFLDVVALAVAILVWTGQITF
ncbi:MAG: hypothetical protein ACWGPS_01310 [Candidatus Promineifilaceae bacterium]